MHRQMVRKTETLQSVVFGDKEIRKPIRGMKTRCELELLARSIFFNLTITAGIL